MSLHLFHESSCGDPPNLSQSLEFFYRGDTEIQCREPSYAVFTQLAVRTDSLDRSPLDYTTSLINDTVFIHKKLTLCPLASPALSPDGHRNAPDSLYLYSHGQRVIWLCGEWAGIPKV